ncbi:MAG: cobalt ECF transporter T component CbiQ [Chloroflexi bacterium]|nr:cobalt ECF transporter T component CbiQ [Chloroflexota bacterium]
MHLHIDEYAGLDSPIHRWNPRVKFTALFLLIIAFSLVQDLRLAPIMLAITAVLYAISNMPLHFLISRLRYPGFFLLALIVILPVFTGQTVIARLGPISIQSEGVEYMLLVVSRFVSILTMSLLIFGTTTFIVTVRTLRLIGIPPLLTDMLLLTVRYIFEFADMLSRMQRAMRMRGFEMSKLNRRGMSQLAGLMGTLLIRSYEQAERVYKAMRLRGYGATAADKEQAMHITDYHTGALALNLADVMFAYPGRPPALNSVSLRIEQGERVGLIGPNGAGKTSLFLAICGVLKPSGGTVMLYDQPVVSGKYHPAIGLVFQNTDDQLFSPTVREDIAFGPVNLGLDEAEVEKRTQEALQLTGMEHLIDRAPHHLSGGEKRMVSIAGVLAMKPGLVLYDEPDANLDMRARRRLIHFLQHAPHTLIVASHDLEMILEVCDRVILLDGGQIIADGPPSDIMADVELMEAHGLEKPHSLVPHLHSDGSHHPLAPVEVEAPAALRNDT